MGNRKAPRRVLLHASSSPRRGKSRTFLNLTILAGSAPAARGAARLAYHFDGTEPPLLFEPPVAPVPSPRCYRNPVALAREWQHVLDEGKRASRADLARKLGVTRARVTQVLSLLDLAPQVLEAVIGLGDPLSAPVVTERNLRQLVKLPAEEQGHALKSIAPFQRD